LTQLEKERDRALILDRAPASRFNALLFGRCGFLASATATTLRVSFCAGFPNAALSFRSGCPGDAATIAALAALLVLATSPIGVAALSTLFAAVSSRRTTFWLCVTAVLYLAGRSLIAFGRRLVSAGCVDVSGHAQN
jgi:hypothetical protein